MGDGRVQLEAMVTGSSHPGRLWCLSWLLDFWTWSQTQALCVEGWKEVWEML
jgi:hypothetical protein